MADFEDELALFESEIAQLDEPLPVYENATISAAPTSSTETLSAPPTAPQDLAPPQPPVLLPPPFLAAHSSPFIANNLARPPGLFMPHQLRGGAPGPSRVSATATIEGAPTLYEAPIAIPQEMLRTQALQSDIDKMNFKKQTDPFKKRIKDQQSKKKYVRGGGGQVWEDPSLAEWDDNDFRVFCGDLGNEVSEELLAKAFRKYPSFQKAKVVRESRTNKSKGYGFVSFRDSEDYIRAMREMDGKYVGNRPIKLRKSSWKDRNMDVIKQKRKQKKELGILG
ncbi:unnamed protein product [Caenorhabditis angaria]|uniref:RNA-binding protein 42 n=1 Tax=Caenorhabditis angaria TaxID=860376 RepID=A0A9P1MZ46_9PELO|nr:unnamed protein product [Caenorhabditis angaria]